MGGPGQLEPAHGVHEGAELVEDTRRIPADSGSQALNNGAGESRMFFEILEADWLIANIRAFEAIGKLKAWPYVRVGEFQPPDVKLLVVIQEHLHAIVAVHGQERRPRPAPQ